MFIGKQSISFLMICDNVVSLVPRSVAEWTTYMRKLCNTIFFYYLQAILVKLSSLICAPVWCVRGGGDR
jgi:hypothetical protein